MLLAETVMGSSGCCRPPTPWCHGRSDVSDGLWELLQPLLPTTPRRYRYPGRRRLDDRRVLNGILYVLATGIAWDQLPQQLGFGSGMTCWRRLRDWNHAGCGTSSTNCSWLSYAAPISSTGLGR